MSQATAALLADELAWIATALKRHIARGAKQLEETDVTGDELVELLKSFGEEVTFLKALLAVKEVRVEDRMGLVLTLRYERSLLRPMWAMKEDERLEIDFIDGMLKRLSRIDWESMGIPDTPYDPCKVYRDFRISEAEVSAAIYIDHERGVYAEAYESLVVGSTVKCTLEDEDGELSSRTISIRITRICLCKSRWSEDDPSGKMFEGDIVSEPSDKMGGDEAFGFLFPGGHTIFMDSSPDSDYTDRHIRAAMCLLPEENA